MVIYILQHELYSLHGNSVLGFVACYITSKRLQLGSAERSWADGKQINDGMQSNFARASLEKGDNNIFMTAKLREANIKYFWLL